MFASDSLPFLTISDSITPSNPTLVGSMREQGEHGHKGLVVMSLFSTGHIVMNWHEFTINGDSCAFLSTIHHFMPCQIIVFQNPGFAPIASRTTTVKNAGAQETPSGPMRCRSDGRTFSIDGSPLMQVKVKTPTVPTATNIYKQLEDDPGASSLIVSIFANTAKNQLSDKLEFQSWRIIHPPEILGRWRIIAKVTTSRLNGGATQALRPRGALWS